MDSGWKCFEVRGRDMEAKDNYSEIPDGNGNHIIGDKIIKDLAEMCSSILWKMELLSDGYLAEEVSPQGIEGITNGLELIMSLVVF